MNQWVNVQCHHVGPTAHHVLSPAACTCAKTGFCTTQPCPKRPSSFFSPPSSSFCPLPVSAGKCTMALAKSPPSEICTCHANQCFQIAGHQASFDTKQEMQPHSQTCAKNTLSAWPGDPHESQVNHLSKQKMNLPFQLKHDMAAGLAR